MEEDPEILPCAFSDQRTNGQHERRKVVKKCPIKLKLLRPVRNILGI
jgi:hypothetical protein